MVTGASAHYVSSGPDNTGLPMATGTYRNAHAPQAPRSKSTGIDFDALAPACKGCGQKSGTVSFKTGLCTACDPATKKAPVKAAKVPKVKRQQPTVEAAPSDEYDHVEATHELYQDTDPEGDYYDPEPEAVPAPSPEAPSLVAQLQAWAARLHALEAELTELLAAASHEPPTAAAVDVPRAAAAAPRPRRPRVTGGPIGRPGKPVDEAAVVREYQAGDTAPAVAARHGVRPKRIREILDRNGVERRDDRPNSSGGRNAKTIEDYDAEQVRDLVERYTAGQTIADAAAALGCSPKLVSTILTKAGVELRPPAHIARATVLDDATRAEIARRYAAGESSTTLAAAFKIRAERCRAVVTGAGVPLRARGGANTGDMSRLLAERGVPVHDVKVWGVAQGLIPGVVRGRAPDWLIKAYAAAHPEVQLDAGRVDEDLTDPIDGQEASA